MLALEAWTDHYPGIPLKIVGDGPLASEVKRRTESARFVEWFGRQPRTRVIELLKSATMLIVPSTWYEGFPMTVVEAFATGVPVIVSQHGSLPGIVTHGVTGRFCRPGDALDLARQVAQLCDQQQARIRMRERARSEYLQKFTGEKHYHGLMETYGRAIACAGNRLKSSSAPIRETPLV
jgi:glycosyltransferase involved in cell wall biosynthesis